jgi:hypothetical protein
VVVTVTVTVVGVGVGVTSCFTVTQAVFKATSEPAPRDSYGPGSLSYSSYLGYAGPIRVTLTTLAKPPTTPMPTESVVGWATTRCNLPGTTLSSTSELPSSY